MRKGKQPALCREPGFRNSEKAQGGVRAEVVDVQLVWPVGRESRSSRKACSLLAPLRPWLPHPCRWESGLDHVTGQPEGLHRLPS